MRRDQNAGFLSPISAKITVTKENERRKRKSEEKERRTRTKKRNGCNLSFYDSYFGRKKLLDAKGSFGDNVFKTPAKITSKAGDQTSSVEH